jgi:hypothetical protein
MALMGQSSRQRSPARWLCPRPHNLEVLLGGTLPERPHFPVSTTASERFNGLLSIDIAS